MKNPSLDVVFCWHMHQPDYRDYASGNYVLPWTYLHALKDYSDMAWYLEQLPMARAVFNFVPILLEQLEDYRDQLTSGKLRDPLLQALALPADGVFSHEQRIMLMESCFRHNHPTMLDPFPGYRRLYELWVASGKSAEHGAKYFSQQYFSDLATWYHLAWTGETVRRDHKLIGVLLKKGSDFTAAERLEVFQLVSRVVSEIIPRYRRLAERGTIELSTTPYFHPILPLLLELSCARDSMPEAPLPKDTEYPGGRARARQHVDDAARYHENSFGHRPQGMWPAEGGVSTAALQMLAQAGMRWAATGEGVLRHTLTQDNKGAAWSRQTYLYRPHCVRVGGDQIQCFFRDDVLSDRIGFEYAKWVGPDAVSDLIKELEGIRTAVPVDEPATVSIILDGENAWEFYPYNGYYFLSELYRRLVDHPFIRMRTFGELAQSASAHPSRVLDSVVAGSWVYGTFSTWIGSPEKNRAWELLCEAKRAYDHRLLQLDAATAARATRQLAICESSDWFWWLGDYNSSASVASFDRLYRSNLRGLYECLNLAPPAHLDESLGRGQEEYQSTGAMRRSA